MGFTWRAWGRAALVVGVAAWAAHGDRAASAKESVSEDSASKVDTDKTDAELMYEALKKSGRNDHDAAIDRAIARAEKDSEKERKALRTQSLAARVWKDPFVDDAAVPVPSRRTARLEADELRAARTEAARARRATAMARAEAALARAETARARADAARAEAVAARADAVAARQACVALPSRGSSRDEGTHQASVRRQAQPSVARSAPRRYAVAVHSNPPVEAPARTVTPATLTVSTRTDAPPPAPVAAPARPTSGFIIVPIPPPAH
jgi:hypothetical protein